MRNKIKEEGVKKKEIKQNPKSVSNNKERRQA